MNLSEIAILEPKVLEVMLSDIKLNQPPQAAPPIFQLSESDENIMSGHVDATWASFSLYRFS